MNYKIVFFILILLISCDKKKEDESKSNIVIPSHIPEYAIYPYVENINDTIINGSYFTSRVFLTNDSLFTVAKSNGVKNYLNIYYGEDSNGGQNINYNDEVLIENDTGRVKNKVYYPGLEKDSVIAHYFGLKFDVKYSKNSNAIDTSFINIGKIYVKGV